MADSAPASDFALAPLYALVDVALQSGVKTLHIVDGNHTRPEPRELYADSGLLANVARHGRPVYAMEFADTTINTDIITYRTAENPLFPEGLYAVGGRMSDDPAISKRFNVAYHRPAPFPRSARRMRGGGQNPRAIDRARHAGAAFPGARVPRTYPHYARRAGQAPIK